LSFERIGKFGEPHAQRGDLLGCFMATKKEFQAIRESCYEITLAKKGLIFGEFLMVVGPALPRPAPTHSYYVARRSFQSRSASSAGRIASCFKMPVCSGSTLCGSTARAIFECRHRNQD
jgi:hypothetical protein